MVILERPPKTFFPVLSLFALLLVSLFLLSGLVENSKLFNKYGELLIAFNILVLGIFSVLVTFSLIKLVRDYHKKKVGSRLTARLASFFIGLLLVPTLIVYLFSNWMLDQGIDSWFNVEVEGALENSLELGRWSLDTQLQQMRVEVEAMVEEIYDTPNELSSFILRSLSEEKNLGEITLFNMNREIIATYGKDLENLPEVLPSLPSEEVLRKVLEGEPYSDLDFIGRGFYARFVFPIEPLEMLGTKRLLQVLYPVPERIDRLTNDVESAYDEYKNLTFWRNTLKRSFELTLALVLLFGVLFAVWAAFYAARRLSAPVAELAQGTKDIAAGKLDTYIEIPSRDELGELVMSFNSMVKNLYEAKNLADSSRGQLEKQRTYLETVLAHLSSGVISLNPELVLKTANTAASDILSANLQQLIGHPLCQNNSPPLLEDFCREMQSELAKGKNEWKMQVDVATNEKRKTLFCRGVRLPGGGHVVVINDITELVQAQRDRVWKDVARRMAHEFKNPLTPIRLSAERLKARLASKLDEESSVLLEHSANTIINQVDAMGKIVNEFRQFSRGDAPLQLKQLDLNAVIDELVRFYDYTANVDLQWQPCAQSALMLGDETRLGQLLHNLLSNAYEALEKTHQPVVRIATQKPDADTIQINVSDNGPGFSKEVIDHVFEPYVTTKEKGQGLGLAIVKKIVDEHQGTISIKNLGHNQGSMICITLPCHKQAVEAQA